MKKILISFLILIIAISTFSCGERKPTAYPLIDEGITTLEIITTGIGYYVSPSGLDTNPCTLALPCKTFQKVVGLAVAGDTIYLRGGTYKERLLMNGKSGNSSGFITIKAQTGETPIIDGATFTASTSSGMIDIRNSGYIRVDGITVINAPQVAIFFHTSNHIQIVNNKTNIARASSGIGVWWSDQVLVSNNIVANSHVLSIADGGHEESISIAGTTNFEISYNEVYRDSAYPAQFGDLAIDCKQGARFGTVHHNYIHDYASDSGTGGIYVDAWERLTGNIDIYNNYINNSSIGIDISSERGGTTENVRIYNNVIYNVNSSGITITQRPPPYDYGIRRNIEIYNNTIYKVKYNGGAGIYITAKDISNIIVRNNIVYMNNWNGSITAASSALLPYIKANNNLVFGSKNCSQAYPNCVEISNNPPGYPDIYGNVTADPKFVSLTIPDLHLQSTSPAINTGVSVSYVTFDYDGNSRPQGAGYDIGAFEFQEGSTPIPTLTPTRTSTATPNYTKTPTSTLEATKTPTISYTKTPTLTKTLVATYTSTPKPTPTPKPKPCNHHFFWWCLDWLVP